jgi:hypothetical protein
MVRWQLPYVLVAVAPGMTLGLVGGVTHLAERAVAPVSGITAEPLDFPRLKLNRERIAAPPPVLEPASVAEPPIIVSTAALAARIVSDASLPEPRAVEVVLPVTEPTVASKSPEGSPKPTGRTQALATRQQPRMAQAPQPQAPRTPRSGSVVRAPQPRKKPRFPDETEANNFDAVPVGHAPPAATRVSGGISDLVLLQSSEKASNDRGR